MKITYRTGDMFAGPERVLVHGCNARGVMGSGVAKAVRDLFPGAYDAYRAAYTERRLALGEVIWACCNGRLIGNAITQSGFGRDKNVVYVNYDAVASALRKVNRLMAEPEAIRVVTEASGFHEATPSSDEAYVAQLLAPEPTRPAVAFPLLGAGLGGGEWTIIAEIIENESENFAPIVYTLDGNIPS